MNYLMLILLHRKNDIDKSFRRIIKKFHPDKNKLTELEEELYYEITTAYHILNDKYKRESYNNFLILQHNSKKVNPNNYNTIKNETRDYFPETKEEAFKSYLKQSEQLFKRHGDVNIKDEKLSTLYKEKSSERKNLKPILKEHFRGNDDFNNTFVNRKINGNYSDNIMLYDNTKIIPFELGKSSLNLTNLSEFHNMYTKNTVRDKDMTSLSHAFLLQPHANINEDFDYNEKINEYENNNFDKNNFDKNNFNF